MNIEVLKRIPFSELESRIRQVPLMKKADSGEEIFVYKDAIISLRELHTDEVNPTTFYLLAKNLDFQRKLHEIMLDNHGIDTLRLDGAVEIQNDKGEIWTLTPPIIEVTPRRVKYMANPGELQYDTAVHVHIPIINDGAHRVALARELGQKFNGIYISGADASFPFYAHPNPWDMVKVVEAVPKSKAEKKFYSRDDCYALYRNFGVLGCGAPRNVSK